MPVWTVLLLGLAAGFGTWLIIDSLFPARPPLADILTALHGHAPRPLAAPRDTEQAVGWAGRTGRVLVPALRSFGFPTTSAREHLALLEKPVEVHLAEQATAAVAGLLLFPILTGLLAFAGMSVPLVLPTGGALILAAAGFVAPNAAVASEAARRRLDATHGLSAYLDLVTLALAGGAGIEQALQDAARIGDGWVFTRIRQALAVAAATRTPAAEALHDLGTTTGLSELTELAASLTIAGAEGARIRASVAAKAASVRTRQLAQAEAEASAATERMSLPVAVLFIAFLVFLGYPALTHVLTGL